MSGDLKAEVVVIGGGYTGLSTALNLRESGIDVILLEREFCGSGASGRNAGHLTPTIGKDLPSLITLYGQERAGRLVRFADDAVAYTESLIERYAIDCEYQASGNIIAGVHPAHEKRMRKAIGAAEKVGARQRFLESRAMRDRGLPPAFLFGVLEEKGGTLDPGRYVAGLRKAALTAGVRMFENTPALGIEPDPAVTVLTAGGSVKAENLVMATNAYTGNAAPVVKSLRRKCIPLLDCMLETEPLTPDQLNAVGWGGREGIYTSHEILESYRLTPRHTIVGGSKFVRYRWNMQLPPGRDAQALSIITAAFRDRFPALASANIRHYWNGWIGFTADFLPLCGVTNKHRNIYYGLGYCGHGMAQATYMGEMLCALILGKQHPGVDVLQRRSLPLPPEPFLWATVTGLIAGLRALDKRTDMLIRRSFQP